MLIEHPIDWLYLLLHILHYIRIPYDEYILHIVLPMLAYPLIQPINILLDLFHTPMRVLADVVDDPSLFGGVIDWHVVLDHPLSMFAVGYRSWNRNWLLGALLLWLLLG